MENQDEPVLSEVRDPAGFIESMRRLKQQSGLTYRELEERASQVGDVLPRSTLADVLRRTSLRPTCWPPSSAPAGTTSTLPLGSALASR